MYGKIFSSMYEGSMVGAGAVAFAIMGYGISKQQPPEFNVELNSKFLSAIFGESVEDIEKAIEYLCSPDPNSRTDREEGRRLLKVGSFTYHMVNGKIYHDMRHSEERKAYNREAQAKYRAKKNLPPVGENEPQKRFQKPSLSDLELDGLSSAEAHKFFNYYESKGWKVGSSPMKKWKAAVVGWKQRSEGYQNGNQESAPTQTLTFKGAKFRSEMTPKERAIFDEANS